MGEDTPQLWVWIGKRDRTVIDLVGAAVLSHPVLSLQGESECRRIPGGTLN